TSSDQPDAELLGDGKHAVSPASDYRTLRKGDFDTTRLARRHPEVRDTVDSGRCAEKNPFVLRKPAQQEASGCVAVRDRRWKILERLEVDEGPCHRPLASVID